MTQQALIDEVVASTKAKMRHWYPKTLNFAGACLYWSHALATELQGRGCLEVQIHAGTALFEAAPPRNDEEGPYVFGYHFNQSEAVGWLHKGVMPEMHCWCFIPSTKEVVDLTTGYQEEQTTRIHYQEGGFEPWHPDYKLPEYVWCSLAQWKHPTVKYIPSPMATQIAHGLLRKHG